MTKLFKELVYFTHVFKLERLYEWAQRHLDALLAMAED